MANRVMSFLGEIFEETVAQGIVETMRRRSDILRESTEERLRRAVSADIEDRRAALLDDIMQMSEAGRNALIRRLQQAEQGSIPKKFGDVSTMSENDVVSVLTLIRTDEDGTRTRKLEWLAGLDDEEFWTYVDLLWHNPVQQEIQRIKELVIQAANEAAEILGIVAGELDELDGHIANKINGWLDNLKQRGWAK